MVPWMLTGTSIKNKGSLLAVCSVIPVIWMIKVLGLSTGNCKHKCFEVNNKDAGDGFV